MSILLIETRHGPELHLYLRSHRRVETVRFVDGKAADVNVHALAGEPLALIRHLGFHEAADYLHGRSDDWRWCSPAELARAVDGDARTLNGDLR